MNAQLMRRALALPAPLLRTLHRTAPIGAAVPPAARQLNLSHPSGWLAAAAELQTYAGPHGEVHYERNGVTTFALGTEGVDARALSDWSHAMRRQGARHTLLFPLALWQRPALHACGFDTLIVGQEAEVYLPAYHCVGGAYANLRHMLRRAHRNGLQAVVSGQLPGAAQALERPWRAGRAQPERMRLLVGLHGACDRALFAVVSTRCGTPDAYVEARPGFNGRGYGVDGMVRAPGAPAGAMELALNSLLEHRREAGDTWFSLGAVPLQGMDRSRPLLALICRGLRETALGNELFHFSGLQRFKAKFAPQWRPVLIGDYRRVGIRSLYEGCRLWGLF